MTTVQITLPEALAKEAANAGLLAPERIAGILREARGDVPKAAKELVTAANERGGEDNITVVLLKFGD